MRSLRLFAGVLLGCLLFTIPGIYITAPSPSLAAQSEPKEIKVWVNTSSGVYHCPGTRWYGNTKHGKYVGECEAIKDGNRPAYGKACGSVCQPGLVTAPSPAVRENIAPANKQAGNPDAKVWVNTNSGVYHCPGTRWYGSTKQGEFMTQKKAQGNGYRPAFGKVCP